MADYEKNVSWREGKWDGDKPVEPVDILEIGHIWYIHDYMHARPRAVDVAGIQFTLRCVLQASRKNDPTSKPPRWWWAPLAEPSNLPAEHSRKNW
jgi:hypothetical protein